LDGINIAINSFSVFEEQTLDFFLLILFYFCVNKEKREDS